MDKEMSKATTHQVIVGKNDLWETPPDILPKAMKRYDVHPVLDVCATDANHKFDSYFTEKDDALIKQWDQDFFMNPPYSQITKWMDYAYTQHKRHNVTALILTFIKLEVAWSQKYIYNTILDRWFCEFKPLDKRIRFLIDGIKPRYCKNCKERTLKEIDICPNLFCGKKLTLSTPTYGSAWIIWRSEK